MSNTINTNTAINGIKPLDVLFSPSKGQTPKANGFFFTQQDDFLLSLSDSARQMLEGQQKELAKVQKAIDDMWKISGQIYGHETQSGQDQWSKLVSLIKERVEERLGEAAKTAPGPKAATFDLKDAIAKLTEQMDAKAEQATQALKHTEQQQPGGNIDTTG